MVLIQISPVVPLILFSGSDPVAHIAFRCHITFSPPIWTVLYSFLIFLNLDIFEEYWLVCSMFLNFGLSDISS